MRRLMPVRVIGAIALALPAGAAAQEEVTFGASLAGAPNVTFGCVAQGTAGAGSSCTWTTSANPADPTEALTTPPGDGTITGVRLRVGQATGPMSLAVLQEQKNLVTGAITCCTATAVTQAMLPAPNEINRFRTDLTVHSDPPGQLSAPGIQTTELLALSVLNAQTPIPAVDETASGLAADQLPQDLFQDPVILQGQSEPATTTTGYQVDMQATWVPGTPAPATPRVVFASGRVFVSHGELHVPLRCRFDTCTGSITVTGSRRTTYATGAFRIGQNLYRSIAVRLTPDGRAAAHDAERRSVSITVTYRTPAAPKRIHRATTVTF